MTKREKAPLRKSVRKLAAQAIYDALGNPDRSLRDWLVICEGPKRQVWSGPEVSEVCREVYRDVCKALKVRAK